MVAAMGVSFVAKEVPAEGPVKERPKLPAPLAFHRKGQQAMALAMIYPEPEKGGRGED